MDEKQLQDENASFKIGYVAAFFTMILCMYLTEIQRFELSAYSSLLICFFITFAAFDISMSVKEVYFGEKARAEAIHLLLCLVGIANVGLIAFRLVNVNHYGSEYLTGGILNDILPQAVAALCMFSTFAVYLIKRRAYKKKFPKEN